MTGFTWAGTKRLLLLLAAAFGFRLLASPAFAQTPAPGDSRQPVAASTAPAPPAVAAPTPIPGGHAVGDLLVAPTRLVFEGRQRAAELTLVNIGRDTATYRISFVQMRMNEVGEFKEIEQAGEGEKFADSLVRFSPRQVTLEPQVAQTIRVQLRKPAELAFGEYRSHLRFRAVPPPEPVSSSPTPVAGAGLSIRLKPIYGVSIPVIVRHGETSAKVTLSDLEIRPGEKPNDPRVLRFQMNRTGNQSVYGNLNAVFFPTSGREQVVGIVNGIAVYTPNPFRVVQVVLRPPPGVTLEKGRLRVTFVRENPRGELLAEAELRLP